MSRISLGLLVVVQVIAMSAGAVLAQPDGDRELTASVERANRIAEHIHEVSGVPGMAFAIGYKGKIVWEKGFGLADVESAAPATPLSKFRVGSVSKAFTAAAVGALVDAGRLDLDGEIQDYVPDFPRKRWPVTTRQVAGHIAGIRHYRGEEFLSDRWYPTVDSGLTIFEQDSLLFEPGSDYLYSSHGFNLVSAIVEGAAQTQFLAFMDETVFEPVGMRNTTADINHRLVPFRTGFYERRDGVWYNAPHVDNSYKWAGGGFLSTAGDMVRFGMALLDDSIVSADTRKVLWTRQVLSNGDTTGYGIGFSAGRDHYGHRTVGHGGGSVGGNAELLIYPEYDLVLASAANANAPIHYNELMAMALPFVDSGWQSDQSFPTSYFGTWACTLSTNNGDQERTVVFLEELERLRQEGGIQGPFAPGYIVAPGASVGDFMDFWSRDRALYGMAMTNEGWIQHLRLEPDASANDRLTGTLNWDPIQCERAR